MLLILREHNNNINNDNNNNYDNNVSNYIIFKGGEQLDQLMKMSPEAILLRLNFKTNFIIKQIVLSIKTTFMIKQILESTDFIFKFENKQNIVKIR